MNIKPLYALLFDAEDDNFSVSGTDLDQMFWRLRATVAVYPKARLGVVYFRDGEPVCTDYLFLEG